jgi:hypothetical protein
MLSETSKEVSLVRSSFGVVLGVAFGIVMILFPRMIYFQDHAVTMAGGSEEIKTASADRSSSAIVGASPLALIIAAGSAAALIAYLSAKRREQGIQ